MAAATIHPGKAFEAVAHGFNSAMATDWASNLAQIIQDTFERSVPTLTDKAMDAVYNATHVGGSWHRLFDGGHSIAGSWQAATAANAGSPLHVQAANWASSYLNDLVTKRGMPLATFDWERVKGWETGRVAHLEAPRGWVKQSLCFNAAEVAGALAGLATLAINWKKGAVEKSAQMVGSFAPLALLQGNPLLGGVAALAFFKAAWDCYQTGDWRGAVTGLARGLWSFLISMAALAATAPAGSMLLTIVASMLAAFLADFVFNRAIEIADAFVARRTEATA
ncbi:MAG: hypothetical protein WDO24_29000 [Pseudomonadota bacterium]